MSTEVLVLATLLKIVFILLVVVGAFAPVLVWAERRQSAMIQDRVGPTRAGIPLPGFVVQMLDALRAPLKLGARLAAVGVVVCVLGMLYAMVTTDAASVAALPLGEAPIGLFFTQGAIALGVLTVLLRVGHRIHTSVVEGGGQIRLLGLLHPLADAVKFIFKEDFVPPKADKLLHALAPIISLVPAIATFAVIPFADVLYLDYWDKVLPVTAGQALLTSTTAMPMQVASLNVGILFIFAVAGTGVIGAAIGGYASDNKYSLIGGIRAASQMVSYEVALGLTLVPCFMLYGSLRLEDMALWQHTHLWGIFVPPLTIASVLFFTAAVAETKRIPFDLPEGESELVGGYLTEYSGMKFGMFFMSEFVEVVALAAIATVLFFGGWDLPFLTSGGIDLPGTWHFAIPSLGVTLQDSMPLAHGLVIAMQVVGFLLKIIVAIWFQLMIRWSLPRFRYDQMMALCWKGLLPLSIVNILFTGLLILLWN